MKNLLVPFCNKNQSLTGETTCRAFQTNKKDPLKAQYHKGLLLTNLFLLSPFCPCVTPTEDKLIPTGDKYVTDSGFSVFGARILLS